VIFSVPPQAAGRFLLYPKRKTPRIFPFGALLIFSPLYDDVLSDLYRGSHPVHDQVSIPVCL
jgi:hypothetical protein